MRKIRVLIVDDSVVIRKIVSEVLSLDSQIEIAGTAANGRIALAKIEQVNPDLVTMDIEMPDMSGFETLTQLRKKYPSLPVIMFSTLTERGGEATFEALSLGANDYVTKPANVGSVNEAIMRIRESLIPKIKAFCVKIVGVEEKKEPTNTLVARPVSRPVSTLTLSNVAIRGALKIVAIGVSTGGPNALADLMPSIPADFPVPIVIVQHMPPLFTKLLAERLSKKSAIPVKEGVAGETLTKGSAWIAPGDFHMIVEKNNGKVRIATHQKPPENSCRPAVDVLFRSVAEVYGAHSLAVVLTGMGQDGLRGCESISQAGGLILAQDEASSVVWGMPGYVARAGLAQKILPLSMIGPEIVRKVKESVGLMRA